MEGDGSDSLVSRGQVQAASSLTMAARRGPWVSLPSAVSREGATAAEALGLLCGGPASSSPPGAGFRNPVRLIPTPRWVGEGVTWARKRAPLGCGYRPPEHLGESGRGTLMEFRAGGLILFRESGARRVSGRVSRRPLSGSARVPLGPPRALRDRPAVTARKAPPRLCLVAEGGLALAAVGLQVVLLEGIEYANLLVSRRTSFILKQLNCGNPHITFLLIRLFPPQ